LYVGTRQRNLATDKNKLDIFFKDLGSLIGKFRKEKKFSLEELGLQIGLDRSHMHRIESGQPITVRTIIKLSLALNKKPKDFFDINFDFENHELGGLVKSKKSPKKKSTAKKK
jgi:transcriptional regulator with XRE-family HTH domain